MANQNSSMYNWRELLPLQRSELLAERQRHTQPWHRPPHGLETHWYHVSAACYEHRPIVGQSPERMASFSENLTSSLQPHLQQLMAWCVLPNHYHLLLQALDLARIRSALGKLHGRCSHQWNVEDEQGGRTCWHSCLAKPVKSEKHRWATLNYIHHNPVHHGYVERWQDWPYSSGRAYLETAGREFAEHTWNTYAVKNMGSGWDEADM